ncbi:hypothetical protein ACFX11_046879 [Malus domestica]
MVEVCSRQPSWEVEFNALLSSTSEAAGPSIATTAPVYSAVLVRILENALWADDDLKTALAVQETLRPKIDALKTKGEALADLDRQMAELAKRRSALAFELARNFESGGKSCLTKFTVNAKRVEQLKLDKKNRQAEVIMREVRWLKLKALLGTLLPSSP